MWNQPIKRSEIAKRTAHNTYQIDGLPPTPICNPGRAAIEAVLNPANTKDLYFVADGNGGHMFAETLKDHNANVQKWRAIEKEREKEAKAKAAADAAPQEPEKTEKTEKTDKARPDRGSADKGGPKGDADKRDADKRDAGKGDADKGGPDKAGADKGKGAGASGARGAPVPARPAAPREGGAWVSTTEPAQPKSKR